MFAYLDPGTGSIIIQALIGVAVGAGVFLKTYWTKIKSILGGKSEKLDEDLRRTNKNKDA